VAKDYYSILGIAKNASPEQIKKAYRKLAMQYHPDRNQGKEEWANHKFKEINEAFSVLGDPDKRKQYDQFGTVGNIGDIFGSTYTRSTFEDLMKDFGGAGLGFDFLDNIFGDFVNKEKGFSFKVFRRGFGGAGGTKAGHPGGINLEDLLSRTQKPPTRDVRYEITIPKEQATIGLEKDLVRKGKNIRVKIPAGVKHGNTVRLRNALQITDGEPGDILITVKVK
jgi:curved DNA-binding protein